MSRIYYGTDSPPQSWERYVTQCSALELHLDALRNKPDIKDLNSWRVKTPKGFGFILHLSNSFIAHWLNASAPLTEEQLEQMLQLDEERAHALSAKAYMLRTPYDFSPSQENKDKLEALATFLKGKKRALIWETQGLWEPSVAAEWGKKHGVMYALDPFIAKQEGYLKEKGDDVCFILTERTGMRRKFDQYDIEDLLEIANGYRRVFILLRGRFKHDHAKEIRFASAQQ